MKKKVVIGLAALLLCSIVTPVLEAEESSRPEPSIDVQVWARPREVSPGDIVYIGGRVTNTGPLPDKVRVCLSVHSRVFSKRLGCYEFKLKPGESAGFRTRFLVPRLRPGTVLVFRACAKSARGASDRDAVRVLVVD